MMQKSQSTSSRLVVLISGNGSNLQAVIDACADGTLNAKVCGVVSSRARAYGVERAQKAGISVCVMPSASRESREAYDKELARVVADYAPDLVVLAGWMHVLTPSFLDDFPGKVINLHPALPGTFVGMNGIRQAYEARKTDPTVSAGVMTHYVIPEVDKGQYIQALRVPIHDSDSYEDLEDRVRKHEKEVLILSLKTLTGCREPPGAAAVDPMSPYKMLLEGKVRDVYDIGYGRLAIVHTDRLSSFDRHICDVPEKGGILTESSAFWF